MSDHDIQLLLARGAGRFFTSARGTQVVSCGVPSATTGPRLVAAASASLLHMVHDSARLADLHIRHVVPAPAAWATLAQPDGRRARSTATALVVPYESQCMLLSCENGQLVALRRFRALTHDAPRLAEAARAISAPLFVAGSADERRIVERAVAATRSSDSSLGSTGLDAPLQADTNLLSALGAQPDALAAAGAMRAAAPRFVTEVERTSEAASTRALVVRLMGAAALCFVVGLALQMWDVRRELMAVRAERSALGPQLGSTLVGRTTVETAFRQLAVLARAEHSRPQWSVVLAALSEQLPSEAYLTGFRGRADTVGVDGLAISAARVFEAVDRVPLLRDVHATSPVRRETTAEGDALERFQLSALLLGRTATARTTAERAP